MDVASLIAAIHLTAGLIDGAWSGVLAIALSALRYLFWGIAGLFVVMTVGVWSATLRTLGFSSLRLSPQMLRLSFRASQIRELSVVLISPLLAISLASMDSRLGQYIAVLPLNALLLIVALFSTLFLVPPTALVLSSSTDRQLRWALELKRFTGGRRVISLLDTGYMAVKPNVSDIWSNMIRRSGSLADVLRTSDTYDWQAGIRELIELSPIVVVDTRVCTQALLFEASTMLTSGYTYKAIFLSEDDGTCPLLERLVDEGRINPGQMVSAVKECELGPLLQKLVASKDALPKPGSFASAPFTIGERIGLPHSHLEAERPVDSAASERTHPATIFKMKGKIRLSTTLTVFWRLMARGAIFNLVLTALWATWMTLMFPQYLSSRFAMVVIWSLFGCYSVVSVLFFYLAHSLKEVYIEGDTLFVSDNAKRSEIHISQISCVAGPDWTTLRRVTLHLHHPCAFGKRFVFAGRLFSAGIIARDLRRLLYSYAEENGKAHLPQQ